MAGKLNLGAAGNSVEHVVMYHFHQESFITTQA
jgi:hypothetical protein